MNATGYGRGEASDVWSVDVCCLMGDGCVLVLTSDTRVSVAVVAEGLDVGRGKRVVAAGGALLPGAASKAVDAAAATVVVVRKLV